jgi:ubiquinone/menaquinone biosynthesis C-methylase UbiE
MTANISFEQAAYEFSEIWDEDFFPPQDHARVRDFERLIPAGTTDLLDAGCGNGLFLNYLQRTFPNRFARLCGVDRSVAALAHVKTEKHNASINQLPFSEGEFDTVSCMEVLEHLPVTIYGQALGELARVARENIVVCVPYNQDLRACLTECPHCFARFNADFHVRSYDENVMNTLFEKHGYEVAGIMRLGAFSIRYDQAFRNKVRSMLRKKEPPYWWPYAICPVCGFTDRAKLTESLARMKAAKASQTTEPPVSQLRKMVRAMLPARPAYRWIAGIYRRR